MSETNNPLSGIETAREEEYMRRHERELIEKLRLKLKHDADARALKAASGVTNDEILYHMAELGIDRATLPVVHLIPLFEVAWADKEIQGNELDLLRSAAAEAGITEGPAKELFEQLLVAPPSKDLCETSLLFINAMIQALPEEEGEKATENLTELAFRVADASGGIFGLFARVEETEREALKHIAQFLGDTQPAAAKKLLDRL